MLSGWLIRWDHDQKLSSESLEQIGMGGFTGRARERMGFVEQVQLPPEIRTIRSSCHTMKDLRLEEEQVVHYHRQLTLEPRAGMAVPEGFGIREFFRLSLDGLLKALDEPRDKMAIYDPLRGRFREVTLPRVYHLNAVLRTREVETGRQQLQGVRVVVDRKRIKRVETVVERQEVSAPAGTEKMGELPR